MATMHPAAMPPAPAVMRILGRFDRQSLASFITVAIELLDVVDGDSDTEPNGDELDGQPSEDEFMLHGGDGPGVSEDAEEDDPSGDPLDAGEADDATRLAPPIYGIDQTTGPINEVAAHRAYLLSQRPEGLR